jgi:hypothetical protein
MKRKIIYCIAATLAMASSASYAQSQRITGGPWFGCLDKEVHSKISKIGVSGDKEAFKKVLLGALMAGACVQLKSGQSVYLEDTSIFSGLVKLRPQGETSGYWTNIEAVSKK